MCKYSTTWSGGFPNVVAWCQCLVPENPIIIEQDIVTDLLLTVGENTMIFSPLLQHQKSKPF